MPPARELIAGVAQGDKIYQPGYWLWLASVSLLFAGFAFAQTGDRGSATGGTPTSSASPGGAAGTSVNGTTQTNQGSAYGNNANGSQTEGTNRNPTNSVNDNSVSQTTGNPGIQTGKVK